MVLPGYCIGDLVENADFLTANDRAMQRIAQAARGITAVVGFIDYNLHEQNDNGTVRKYNAAAVVRDGRILQRAEVAASQLSLLRRQAVFHTWRIARTGRCRDAARTGQRRGLDLRGHVGRVLRRQAAARAERQGSHGPPEPERITVLSGQAERARRADP